MAPRIPTDRKQEVSAMDLQTTLVISERQFRRACDQIVLMNLQLKEIGIRYKRAKHTGQRSFRYPLRLKLAVVEGVRNMYYDFARQKAEEVEALRYMILGDDINDVGHVDVADD